MNLNPPSPEGQIDNLLGFLNHAAEHVSLMLAENAIPDQFATLKRAVSGLRLELPAEVFAGFGEELVTSLGMVAYVVKKLDDELAGAKKIGFDPGRPDGGIQKLVAEVLRLRAEVNDSYTDERGTVWHRPTAEAYQKTCAALHRHEQEVEEKEQARAQWAETAARLLGQATKNAEGEV